MQLLNVKDYEYSSDDARLQYELQGIAVNTDGTKYWVEWKVKSSGFIYTDICSASSFHGSIQKKKAYRPYKKPSEVPLNSIVVWGSLASQPKYRIVGAYYKDKKLIVQLESMIADNIIYDESPERIFDNCVNKDGVKVGVYE